MSAPYLDDCPKYYKPLTLEERLLIDVLTVRYESVEAPFIAIDRGEFIELRHTPTIRRVVPYETRIVQREANEVHGLSANGGSSDRSC